ncbi:hypothetical protein ABF86_01525 [Nitrosomonas sp. GH22]|uniref:hypothetical protein n=1 Tax=Nitrosomonas sp. GH22 TaxID=153947 RepID=UPI00136FAA0C|nr:hypothetical protein [Nitrosomonas sp. GH22]MXS79470.1 hypothetical protein [Nitrosomonas sp. GH22]
MNQATQKINYIAFKALAISCLIVFILFLWQGNKGFNLWDEGFLWYGVQRVLLGEIPIRDFMAYDPGRYYWSAALVSIFGDNGIMSLRVAVAAFQALGLFVGLFLVAQSQRVKNRTDIAFLFLSVTILAVWMFPRHKLFDISISIFLIGILTYLVSNPIPKRYLIAGICVGLIAVFGRNHGVYGAVGSLGVIAWFSIKNHSHLGFIRAIFLWAAGVVIGFFPVILMVILIPGFGVAFWESIQFLFEVKATNLPLPVPWPWTVNFVTTSADDAARGILIGLFFIGTLVFAGLSLAWVVYQKFKDKPVPPVLVASAFLAFPYAHYAFSRADVGHLAQGVFPLLVGCLVLLASSPTRFKWSLALALSTASIWVMYVFYPGWQCLTSKQCVSVEISGEQLKVDPGTANDIALLHQLSDQFAPNEQTFITTPFWPGAYALLGRKSPMWEIYALFPRTEAFENKEIERIKASNPAFVFVFDLPLDGRDELRFKNTHPLIHQYIFNNFDPVSISQNPAYQIYKARGEE